MAHIEKKSDNLSGKNSIFLLGTAYCAFLSQTMFTVVFVQKKVSLLSVYHYIPKFKVLLCSYKISNQFLVYYEYSVRKFNNNYFFLCESKLQTERGANNQYKEEQVKQLLNKDTELKSLNKRSISVNENRFDELKKDFDTKVDGKQQAYCSFVNFAHMIHIIREYFD